MYETYWLLPAMVLAPGSKPAQKVEDSVAEGRISKSSCSKKTKSGKELRASKNLLSEDSPPNKRRLSLQLDTAIARGPGLKAVQPKSGPAAQLNSSSQRGLNARILTARRRRCPKPGHEAHPQVCQHKRLVNQNAECPQLGDNPPVGAT